MKVFDIEVAEKFVSGGVGELGLDNTAAPQDGNVKFTVMPKGGGEGARRADACAHCYSYLLRRLGFASADIFGFDFVEASLRRLR